MLQKLQIAFAQSQTFASLREHQPKRPSKDDAQIFKIGHSGTLDPLASGVLIVGIGRGTKQLQRYLASTKTYETVVTFGASTNTYDCTGVVAERAECQHVTRSLVEEKLELFRGQIAQVPPIYSALKINGVKACDYARGGRELPRQLESRDMQVDECTFMEWYEPGQHTFTIPGEEVISPAPAVRIRLTVSSGFYVRSFAHDIGLACGSRAFMASLLRTRQATFTIHDPPELANLITAITYADLEAGEEVWGPRLRPQLEKWVEANPIATGHVDGRDPNTRRKMTEDRKDRPKQRFRGEYVAETKRERIKQQGGKFKGKWNRRKIEKSDASQGALCYSPHV